MSKRTSKTKPESVSKLLRTDIPLRTEVTQSPYFAEQASDPTSDKQIDRNIYQSKEKDDGEETQTIQSAELENQEIGSRVQSDGDPPGGSSNHPRMKLLQEFYDQNCTTLAKALLGQVVVRMLDGVRISGRIVETESYLGNQDQASHSNNGKRTARNMPMYMKPGTSYVYTIYGMYYCFNISSKEEGSCVLIRALEALEGMQKMQVGRSQRRKDQVTPLKLHQLCNGPSKLCQALHLTKDGNNMVDLTSSNSFWLESGIPVPTSSIVITKRVGIKGAGEDSANKPLRFYELDSKFVSVRDKVAEEKMRSG